MEKIKKIIQIVFNLGTVGKESTVLGEQWRSHLGLSNLESFNQEGGDTNIFLVPKMDSSTLTLETKLILFKPTDAFHVPQLGNEMQTTGSYTQGSLSHPQRLGDHSSPASLPCTGSSEQCPVTSTPPGWIPQ